MTSSLRERRRQETAREIQKATLELAMQKSVDDITTEEIAVAAGVSTRTFFNYYPNKEAAAIGHPPRFSDEAKDALRKGAGSLTVDIKALLDEHMKIFVRDEAIVRGVGNVLRTNEKARGILDGFLLSDKRELTEVLCSRVENRQAATALAKNAVDAIGGAIFLWEHSEDMSLHQALDVVWDGLLDASRILSSSPIE